MLLPLAFGIDRLWEPAASTYWTTIGVWKKVAVGAAAAAMAVHPRRSRPTGKPQPWLYLSTKDA